MQLEVSLLFHPFMEGKWEALWEMGVKRTIAKRLSTHPMGNPVTELSLTLSGYSGPQNIWNWHGSVVGSGLFGPV